MTRKKKGTVPPKASKLVRDAVLRMQDAPPSYFTQQEWDAFASYEGPIVSGDPEGAVPENLPADDNE
jgi:hypothetical protein